MIYKKNMNLNIEDWKKQKESNIKNICLDVRTVEEYTDGNIKDSINIDFYKSIDFMKFLDKLDKDVIDIMASLKKGPIAIALDASPFEFRFYRQGVIDVSPSNYSKLNNAVLLTGYSTYENGSYWLIQNSWGEKWGDNGYVKIKIDLLSVYPRQ